MCKINVIRKLLCKKGKTYGSSGSAGCSNVCNVHELECEISKLYRAHVNPLAAPHCCSEDFYDIISCADKYFLTMVNLVRRSSRLQQHVKTKHYPP